MYKRYIEEYCEDLNINIFSFASLFYSTYITMLDVW